MISITRPFQSRVSETVRTYAESRTLGTTLSRLVRGACRPRMARIPLNGEIMPCFTGTAKAEG